VELINLTRLVLKIPVAHFAQFAWAGRAPRGKTRGWKQRSAGDHKRQRRRYSPEADGRWPPRGGSALLRLRHGGCTVLCVVRTGVQCSAAEELGGAGRLAISSGSSRDAGGRGRRRRRGRACLLPGSSPPDAA
jgi:hypothetical protein